MGWLPEIPYVALRYNHLPSPMILPQLKRNSTSIFAFILLCSLALTARAQEISLIKKWETDTLFKVPESVIYDQERKVLYVANINGVSSQKDSNGFISKVSLTGKIENLEWIKGLNAPKGMGIYKNKLYVTDLSNVTIIDIPSGKIERSVEVQGATFLNDITIDSKGNVYISDSGNKKIYILQGDAASLWLETSELQKPNGLLALGDGLRLIDMGSGTFYNISYEDKKLQAIAQNVPMGDGVVEITKGEYLISNWNGEINYVKGSTVQKLLDTKPEKINAADVWYVPEEKLLVVPTFYGNKIVAYLVHKK